MAFDLETTGLSPATDRIVEIGVVRFEPSRRELDRFARLVHPGRPMPLAAQRAYGPDRLARISRLVRRSKHDDLSGVQRGLRRRLPRLQPARAGRSMPGHAAIDALTRRRLPGVPIIVLTPWPCSRASISTAPTAPFADSTRVKALWLALAADVEPAVASRTTTPTLSARSSRLGSVGRGDCARSFRPDSVWRQHARHGPERSPRAGSFTKRQGFPHRLLPPRRRRKSLPPRSRSRLRSSQ